MEHMIITDLENNMVNVVPDQGYKLVGIKTENKHYEAVINRELLKYFIVEAV